MYLCWYQSDAKNKMLALESVDLELTSGEWYKITLAFWDGNIRVFLNEEVMPRIAVKNEDYLKGGAAVLGGGWLSTEYKELTIDELTPEQIENYQPQFWFNF